MDRKLWCAAVVSAISMIPVSVQASVAGMDIRIAGLGAPFADSTGVYGQYYWSGAYAEAEDDWLYLYDDGYDPLGSPWPGVASLIASASIGGSSVSAETAPGEIRVWPTAAVLSGWSWAHGYADAVQWIDFEVTDSPVTVGVAYGADYAVLVDTPQGLAFVSGGGWAGLSQWIDDNLDGEQDFGEWFILDEMDFSDSRFIEGPDFEIWSDGGDYWFDELVVPGVYSLSIGGWGEAGAADVVPVPGAWLLGGLGTWIVGGLLRRRML